MSRRIEPLSAGLALLLVLIGLYSDKLFGSGYIFTEVIQDITNIYGFYPWDHFSSEQLRAGYFPLWNSHNGLGVPHLANMQSAFFYPLNWLKFIFGFWPAIDWLLIIRLWLSGFFLYLFARSALGLDFISGIFAGLSYMLCGYFLRYVYMSHLNVECLLPLQLYLFHRLAASRKLIFWILSGLGIYLLITGGFPEAGLYAILFSSLYFLFRQSNLGFGRKSGLLASSIVFGILLASAQWIPFYEYLGQAWTYHQEGAGIRHLDPAYAISMLLPWFFGRNSESALIGFLVPGLGTVAVIFCLRAILGIGSGLRKIGFWFFSLIFLLGLIYGLPPFSWLGRIYPFSLTYNYKYAVPVLSLSVSVLAGFGLFAFLRESRRGLDFSAMGLAWVWAGINLLIALMNGFRPFYGLGAKLEMARLAVIMMILLLALAMSRRKVWMSLSAILIILAGLGSVYFDYQMNRGVELSGYLFGQMEEARELQEVFPEPYRYSAEGDILFPNLLLPAGIDELRSYDPLYPRSYVYLLAGINGLSGEEEINRHYQEHKLFQIDREHLNSSLAPVLNLMLYSADYELDSRPIAGTLLKEGKEIGDFAGWAREEVAGISGANKKSLLTHSNGKLFAELLAQPLPSELYFDAGIAPRQGKFSGDGAQFQLILSGAEQSRLGYSRYLNPARRSEDRSWKPASIKLGSLEERIIISLVSLSGPRGDNQGDTLAWAGLRFYSPRYQAPQVENWTEKGELSLNYLTESFPRYFLVAGTGFAPFKNLEEELKMFRGLNSVQPGYFRNQAVVSEQIKFDASRESIGGPSWVQALRQDPEQTELKLRAPRACFLMASEQYFPGWRARVDGKEARIYRADLALRAVFIPAGEHQVVFWYEPGSFRLGLWVSLSGVFSLVMVLISSFKKRSSRR